MENKKGANESLYLHRTFPAQNIKAFVSDPQTKHFHPHTTLPPGEKSNAPALKCFLYGKPCPEKCCGWVVLNFPSRVSVPKKCACEEHGRLSQKKYPACRARDGL